MIPAPIRFASAALGCAWLLFGIPVSAQQLWPSPPAPSQPPHHASPPSYQPPHPSSSQPSYHPSQPSSQPAQSSFQPEPAPPWPTPPGDRGAAAQPELLSQMLDRYREIERRGGWKAVPTDLTMGSPYSYDCRRIEAVERRLIAEGYLDRLSVPPPPPPTAPQGQRRPAPHAAAPTAQQPMGKWGQCPYTRELTDAVRNFQSDRKILGDGQIGQQTMRQLNRPVEEIIDLLEHDIARWRNVQLEPSGTYLLVNIPFYELIAYRDGHEELRMPVIVGQPTWQTPEFSARVQYAILNPEWGIPKSIAEKEIWPNAKHDRNYLAREGIVGDASGLRQKPGPRNPLGKIKFMMPNPNDVYLHDTPTKQAFNAAVKAISHGCVRLSRPMDLAHYLFAQQPEWSGDRIDDAIATHRTQQINLREPMPVHIIYSTTRVNDQGRLEIRPDVYEKNKEDGQIRGPSDESREAWP